MGIGFTIALFCMGAIRELLGSGTLFAGTPLELHILDNLIPGMGIFNLAPGGFFSYAICVAAVAYLTTAKVKKEVPAGLPTDEEKEEVA
jgi:electron transport complex protein RnfE